MLDFNWDVQLHEFIEKCPMTFAFMKGLFPVKDSKIDMLVAVVLYLCLQQTVQNCAIYDLAADVALRV